MFRYFQAIIRDFRRSLLKLLHIHDLVRFFVNKVLWQHIILCRNLVESVVGWVCVVCCVVVLKIL